MKAIHIALFVVIVLLVLALFTLFQSPTLRGPVDNISYSQFLTQIEAGKVRDVLIQGSEIHGTLIEGGGYFQTYAPFDPTLIPRLFAKNVVITARPWQADNIPWPITLLMGWLPFIAIIWVIIHRTRRPKS